MNVVDSSGWLEYFGNGANVEYFAPVIEKTKKLIVPTISLFEVFKRVYLQRGESEALVAAAIMQQGKLIELDSTLALSAARISAELSHPMAVSVMLATARASDATLWTQDSDFDGLDGVEYVPAK
jgi:predicted nucleic acid-binding protein